jgi:uncharacterized protein
MRILWRSTVWIVIVLTLVVVGVAWRYSEKILGPDQPPPLREQRVLAAGSGEIRLTRDAESLQPGTWALEWPGGFGWVGRVLRSDGAGVSREFRAVSGRPPVNEWASLRGIPRSSDPRTLLGLAFENVACDGPLGAYPAWRVGGPDSTWVIYVHGRGANRAEGLRTLGVLSARGLPGLLVTYRNDPGAPASRDGRYHLGLTEWEDLEAAVRYALAHGARGVVLAGYSMGGHVAMQFMTRSREASRVRAVVLESPVLDWNATIAYRSRVLGVPAVAAWLGRRAAGARADLDWNRLNLVARADRVSAPILIFHCLGDRQTPVAVSEAFAGDRAGQVTLVRIPAGNHVEAWNADPARYAGVLDAWMAAHGIGSDPR